MRNDTNYEYECVLAAGRRQILKNFHLKLENFCENFKTKTKRMDY